MENRYLIIDEFKINGGKVITLDRPYEFSNNHKAVIDGKQYDYYLNSIPDWIAIKSNDSFKGKELVFE